VCEDCGLVVEEDRIDRGPDWRGFDDESSQRGGRPLTEQLHDRGLSTDIDWRDSDANGNTLSSAKQSKMKRLRRWNERFRAKDALDRNLKFALGEISRMASALGLPDATRETASVIYRRALEEDLIRGRSIEGVASAAVAVAYRQHGVPHSLDELSAVSRVDRQRIVRAFRLLNRELSLEITPPDPCNHVTRYASELGFSNSTEQRANALLETAKAENIHSSKNPIALAAGALYAAQLLEDGDHATQARISDLMDISEVTIRTRYQQLLAANDIPLPR
jgi:transcription initiation factor TFIIB